MRNVSQTLIGILRDEVAEYRRTNRLSRETVASDIVEAHEAIGADAATGIRFEPRTTDTFERTKVNADRIFRWLDDSTKDSNLMPANFLVSALAGLPEEVRRRVLDRFLAPLGFAVRAMDAATGEAAFSASVATELMREQNEAAIAMTGLLDGYSEAELSNAHREVSEAIDAGIKARALIEATMASTTRRKTQ